MHTPASNPGWDWKSEGFMEAPAAVLVARPFTLYRVWGGSASETGHPARPGVCLSFQQPKTRKEAEGLFSVFEWGNACRHVTPFQAMAGATLFVGKAHPGDFFDAGLGAPGSQVFVEMKTMRTLVRKMGPAIALIDDLKGFTVGPGRDPGRRFSS